MALKDAKELSMDEILASIRSILHESENVRHADTEEGYVLPVVESIRTTVPERPEIKMPELRAETSPIFEPKTNVDSFDDTQEDVATICSNIQKLMQQSDEGDDNRFTITVDDGAVSSAVTDINEPFSTEQTVEIKDNNIQNAQDFITADELSCNSSVNTDISSQIIDSFAAVFAQRRQNRPLVDMSVRELAESAVINEVVPVLAQWLNDYLPDIIQKEIERVMVKAGNR